MSSIADSADSAECIVYTWDYHSSLAVWNGLRTQPILADEVQTFKSLIVVHKLLQEGHPVVSHPLLSSYPITESIIKLTPILHRRSKSRTRRRDGSRRVAGPSAMASRATVP